MIIWEWVNDDDDDDVFFGKLSDSHYHWRDLLVEKWQMMIYNVSYKHLMDVSSWRINILSWFCFSAEQENLLNAMQLIAGFINQNYSFSFMLLLNPFSVKQEGENDQWIDQMCTSLNTFK